MLKPKIEFDALGTHWWIELLDSRDDQAISQLITSRVMTFQSDYSRFEPSSYIGQLNRDKRLLTPPTELIDMLVFAHTMYDVSHGIFNISVGGALARLGYGFAQKNAHIYQNIWEDITYSAKEITLPPHAEIDLGGFGKGWLVDQIGKLLYDNGREQFVINGGGDILVSSFEPIELALEHPIDSTQMIGTTRISQGALAVSSTKKRVWKQGKSQHHHIIDPRSQDSSDSSTVATFVRADSALIADTMATILLIAPELDEELGQKFSLQTILVNESALG